MGYGHFPTITTWYCWFLLLFVFVLFYPGNRLLEALEFQVKGGQGLLESVFIFYYQLFYVLLYSESIVKFHFKTFHLFFPYSLHLCSTFIWYF